MDIAFAVSKAASKASECPKTAWYMFKRILRYLKTNQELGIRLTKSGDNECIRCFTDASWAPGNGRSQSGIIVCMGDTPLVWKSSKQSLTALSSAEAELIAVTQGFQYAMGVEAVMACMGWDLPVTVLCDNAPTIQTIKGTVSWRSRYYTVRASRLRDAINRGVAKIEFTPGIHQVADILTKYTDRNTTIHCLKLMNHVTTKNMIWQNLDPVRLRTKAISSDESLLQSKQNEYDEDVKHTVMTVYVDKETTPLLWSKAKQERLSKWPESTPRPVSEDVAKNCWRAGPFGVWTPPTNKNASALISIPGGGEGRWGVSSWGTQGVFVKNPKNEDGTWHDEETPKCPYCGKGRGDTCVMLRLQQCLCTVEGSKRGMSNHLPMWPCGQIHKSKIKSKEVINYNYERNFPEVEKVDLDLRQTSNDNESTDLDQK
jgi:hypothetical protein